MKLMDKEQFYKKRQTLQIEKKYDLVHFNWKTWTNGGAFSSKGIWTHWKNWVILWKVLEKSGNSGHFYTLNGKHAGNICHSEEKMKQKT